MLAKLTADLVEDNLKQAADLLLVTSLDPRLKSTPYVSNISESYRGIPAESDSEKRDIAMQILALDKNFGSVYYLLLNADVYLGSLFRARNSCLD